MLVLLDEEYFSRLWCVFEFAAFVHRAGLKRVEILPLHVPLYDFTWIVFYSVINLMGLVYPISMLDPLGWCQFIVLVSPLFVVMMRVNEAGQQSRAALGR